MTCSRMFWRSGRLAVERWVATPTDECRPSGYDGGQSAVSQEARIGAPFIPGIGIGTKSLQSVGCVHVVRRSAGIYESRKTLCEVGADAFGEPVDGFEIA